MLLKLSTSIIPFQAALKTFCADLYVVLSMITVMLTEWPLAGLEPKFNVQNALYSGLLIKILIPFTS